MSRFDSAKKPGWLFITALLGVLTDSTCAADNEQWVESWYSAPEAITPHFSNSTLRTVVHLGTGGNRLRLQVSNEYGATPLNIGCVRVESDGVGRDISFSGRQGAVIPPGVTTASDPIDISTVDNSDLVVYMFFPGPIPEEITFHPGLGQGNATVTAGNIIGKNETSAKSLSLRWTYFLVGVEVREQSARGTIVAIGDSITEGDETRWPALLRDRLYRAGKHYAVINAGLSGNRILRNNINATEIMSSAINRFDRDVLSQPGVKYVILYEGINDLGNADREQEQPDAADITNGIGLLARRAHNAGLKIFVATLPPYEGTWAPYYSSQKNEQRKRVNDWIRSSREIDGYLDFEQAIADPENGNRLRPEFDSGDHLHPNAAGEIALSKAVDLSIFE